MDKITQDARDQSVKESLMQRDQSRKSQLKNLKSEKKLSAPDQAKVFETAFEKDANAVLEGIQLFEKTKLPELILGLREDVNALKKYLSVSTIFLTNYTINKCSKTIEHLENKITDFETSLFPKKKFGFKSKVSTGEKKPINVSGENYKNINKDEDTVDSAVSKFSFNIMCGFSDKVNENLELSREEILKNEVQLRNLENCTVVLCGNPSTIHMSNITRCNILCGPVSTSVFIECCTDSNIVVACQQLRIHSTTNSRFYIHITSRPIIEDSHDVLFAPYNLQYEQLQSDYKTSALNEDTNNWNKVDDFNWLASDAHSPNWNLIPLEDRVNNWFPV